MIELSPDFAELFEPHPVPEWAERVCADFGHSESGLPYFRVMWNPDRLRVMNCMDPDTLGRIHRTIHKYPNIGYRWIVEVLLPWEKYGLWHEEFFGAKPPDGEYMHTHTIQMDLGKMTSSPGDDTSEYMSLDDFGSDNLRLLLTVIERNKAIQAWQIRKYDDELIELEEKEFKAQFDNVYEDNMAAIAELEKLQEKSGLITSLDALPKSAAKQQRVRGRQDKKILLN